MPPEVNNGTSGLQWGKPCRSRGWAKNPIGFRAVASNSGVAKASGEFPSG